MASVSSTNRIPGLATGMDTDQMVKDMLINEQNKIDSVKQSQQITTWKQEQYRDIITDVKGLYDKYFDILSPDTIISDKAFSITTITSSNTGVVSATAVAGSVASDYKFEVNSIAVAPKFETSIPLTKGMKLSEFGVSDEINFKLDLGNNISTDTITINKDDTIESLAKKINDASNGNVKAVVSEMTGKLTIESTITGANSSMSIVAMEKGPDGKFVETGKTDSLSFLGFDGAPVSGKDAEIIVKDSSGAILKELKQDKNRFTIDGVTYNVNGVGNADLSCKTDTTAVVDKMKAFVDEYNKMIESIYSKVNEKKERDYPPLTEAQKKEMSEDEIKSWEAKAKKGHLRNDDELKRFLNDLNSVFQGTLSKFGIKSKTDYNKPGQLELDAEILTKELQTNGENVFKNISSALDKTKDIMYKYVGTAKGILIEKSGIDTFSSTQLNNLFSKEIKAKEEQVKLLLSKMKKREDSLYLKFAKLESSMNKFNSQMNYLSQM